MSGNKENRDPITPRDVLIPLGVGLVLGIVTFMIRGGFTAGDREAFWSALCDALAVPGLLLTCAGLLSVVSGQGAFDAVSFSTRKMFVQILSEEKRKAMPNTYYDYVTMKQEKRQKKPRTHLYIGLAFLALAAAALAVYLNAA